MSKTVTIPFEEYTGMVNTIQAQKESIRKLINKDNVVLVDKRHTIFGDDCPKIIANKQLSKEYLREEFDLLHKKLAALEQMAEPKEKPKAWWKL